MSTFTKFGSFDFKCNRIFRATISVFFIGICGCIRLMGQDLIRSDFTGPDPASQLPITATTQLAPQVSTTGWTLSPALLPASGIPNRLAFSIDAPNDIDLTSLSDAIAEDEYLTISISSPDPIDLGGKRLSYSIERSTWHAARQYAVLTSVDGFLAPVQRSRLLENADQGREDFTFIFPLTGFDDLSSPVEIRIYAHAARYNNHVTSLSAFSITDPGPVYALSTSATHGGSLLLSPDSALFTQGEQVTLTAIPPEGHRFAGWSGTASGGFNPLTLSMTENTEIEATFVPNAEDHLQLSTNLPQITYWATYTPFTNLMRYGGRWVANAGGDAPELGPQGYPLEVPYDNGSGVLTTVRSNLPNFVAGNHQVTFDGTGTLRFTGPAGGNQTFSSDGTLVITDPGANLILNVLVSDPADPVRNIGIHLPGFDESTTFHPDFLEDIAPYSALRFMDWGQTNSNPITSWDEVPGADYYSQGRTAVLLASYETLIELANLTQKDPWICVPHLVDDEYVTHLATLLRDSLDPGLQVYLEYSNETWNNGSSFLQTYYTRDQGLGLNLSANAVEAGHLFTAMRSAQIWQLFRDVFDDNPQRIINVMPSWATSAEVSQLRLEALGDEAINPSGIRADALAVAPYFGNGIQQAELDATGYPSVDDLVTTRSIDAIAAERLDLQEQKEIANFHGVRLICYEGGQHWTVPSSLSSDQTLIELMSATNRDPRMYDRYLEYLDMLNEVGVDQFFHFQLTEGHSRYGFFGSYEFQNQDLSEAPKARALVDWGLAHPVSPSLSYDRSTASLTFLLLPGRRYSLLHSVDLDEWFSMGELEEFWGDYTSHTVPVQLEDPDRKGFWRLQAE
ncbi:hypothetical protein P3T73_08260 [Kiritimatiellota bacterium B12222]|nr:hypothetical protein P3T73_08260 [Kiritimatiellota bacterium B12222]